MGPSRIPYRTFAAGADAWLGFVTVSGSQDDDDDPAAAGQVSKLYVDPDHPGIGVGRA